MGALNREGTRREIANVVNPGLSHDEPAFTLSISNLREVQWNSLAISADGNGYRERTNWSGEILPDRWMHIASVNDPVARTSTPTSTARRCCATRSTRSASPPPTGRGGIGSTGGNGWFGCVGETRIVDRATSPDQWLTQRRYFPAVEEPTVGGSVPATLSLDPRRSGHVRRLRPGPRQDLHGHYGGHRRLRRRATRRSRSPTRARTPRATLSMAPSRCRSRSPASVPSKPTWNGPTSNEKVPRRPDAGDRRRTTRCAPVPTRRR